MDSPPKRDKLKARQKPKNAARTPSRLHAVLGARLGMPAIFVDNAHSTHLDEILPIIRTLAITKKDSDKTESLPLQSQRPSEN